METTLALIKPDAVQRNIVGQIITMIENDGFLIKKMKLMKMSDELAKKFYSVHEGKEFFSKLIKYMTSSDIVALVLVKEDAISSYRKLIGATDPETAEENTIRKLFAIDKSFNSVHGSDSIENAQSEISIIFGS
ncbi:MAG: nucleoside-diphosphate kinase [Gammaproteobacteria bacterium]|nr:nucleoside-diphosphate kinase [Gammaproteobacteria bacterium]MBL6819521.1 nucleoside-diphosphate kinase [Gammaproteobacteria bacterium]MBL6898890.1 nucleoside-diphosphate kinase [Gammaproteobacteria bacterium]